MKIIIAALLVMGASFMFFGGTGVLVAESTSTTIEQLCGDAATNNGGTRPAFCDDYDETNKETNPVVGTINKVANIIAYLAAAIAIIMVMYGGFLFMISDGSSDKVSKGRQTILYAAVGLAVIIAARLLINFAVMVLT
jgi:magnesium-transporting ATPase (P-type)